MLMLAAPFHGTLRDPLLGRKIINNGSRAYVWARYIYIHTHMYIYMYACPGKVGFPYVLYLPILCMYNVTTIYIYIHTLDDDDDLWRSVTAMSTT